MFFNFKINVYLCGLKKRINTLLTTVLVALFVSYYSFSSFFVHCHDTPYGVITHSHPYTTDHSHSANSLQLISSLNALIFVLTVACAASLLIGIARKIYFSQRVQSWHKPTPCLIKGRAPPVFVK